VNATGGSGSIFRRAPRFHPSGADLDRALSLVAARVRDELGFEAGSIERLRVGQGLNFAMRARPGAPVRYRLKLPVNRGYPSLQNLRACEDLLQAHDVPHPRLVLADETDSVVPFGYLVQAWIEGEDVSDRLASPDDWAAWTTDVVASVRPVHGVRMDAVGALAGGPRYPTLIDYYRCMFDDVSASFHSVLEEPASLWDLVEAGVVAPAFLERTERSIRAYIDEYIHNEPATLLHGDLLPGNLIYGKERRVLIDWDEARSGWWPYEVARLTFYFGDAALVPTFIQIYTNGSAIPRPYLVAVRLEHARMLLRKLFQIGFDSSPLDQVRTQAHTAMSAIDALLGASLDHTGRLWA
jgi:hypothetical protein